MQALLIVAKGFLMGAADVVPGVSGGTMAFIVGIYERLLGAIRAFDLELLALLRAGRIGPAARHVDLPFLLPLGAGIFAALMFFTRVVPLPRLITTHPEQVYGLFFGLIVASVGVLIRSLRQWRTGDFGWLTGGTVAGLVLVNLVPMDTPDGAWFVFLSGAVAISAMLLPGVSGSFILLVLRKYAHVFDAIGRLDLAVITPFALGCVVGLMAFSRVLTWLLARYHHVTLVFISGLLVGSLWIVWPFQERTFETVRGKSRLIASEPVWPAALDAQALAAIAWCLAGVGTVALVSVAARRRSASPSAQ